MLVLGAAGQARDKRMIDDAFCLVYHRDMGMLVPERNPDHILLDSGRGRKLEIFSGYTVDRPEPRAEWPRSLPAAAWAEADAVAEKAGRWLVRREPPAAWAFRWKNLRLRLKLAPYKHTGIFPEQQANWKWLEETVRMMGPDAKVLNLFAYTGGATLACAAAGARVCHVDSSRPAVAWARENQRLSHLESKPVRWIVEDCLKFAARESRRGAKYQGIIMDPPAFGRGPGGKVFKFGRDVPRLMEICRGLMADGPRFFLINAYNAGLEAGELRSLVSPLAPSGEVEHGGLGLRQETGGRVLACGTFARFRAR